MVSVDKGGKPIPLPLIETTITYPDGETGKRHSLNYLRHVAKIIYTTNTERITIAALRRMPMFQHVEIKTLEAWCLRDSWVELRTQNADEWRIRISREIGTTLVRQKRKLLERIEKIADAIADQLDPVLQLDENGKPIIDPTTGKPRLGFQVEARSYEGLATAYTRVVDKVIQLHESVHDSIMPDIETAPNSDDNQQGPSAQQVAAVRLDPDKAQEMAVMLLRIQNSTGQPLLPAPVDEEEGAPGG